MSGSGVGDRLSRFGQRDVILELRITVECAAIHQMWYGMLSLPQNKDHVN